MGAGAIPRTVHFVHGLATSADDVHFGYEHYLAVVAAAVHIRPDAIAFHHHHRPRGEWWERALPLLDLRQIELPREIFGRPLAHAAHRADVVRLRALLREGGIYLDMDVIALRSFDALLAEPVPALGLEGTSGEHGLCNAVIVSPAGAPFLVRWLDAYRSFDGARWAEHSVALPLRLARAHPAEVRQLGAQAFFWPLWDDAALRRLLLYREYAFAPNYAAHLWAQASRPHVLSLWSPAFVHAVPSALNCRLRALLRAHGAGEADGGGAEGAEAPRCGCAPAELRGEAAGAAPGAPQAPLHRWPLVRGAAFGHGGRAEARTRFCFARDTAEGGCAHMAFFAQGCAPAGEEGGEEEEHAGAEEGAGPAPFSPYALGGAGGAGGALRWSGGLEGFAALEGGWLGDFSIRWRAAARQLRARGGAGGRAQGPPERVWWSLVLAGGGELSAALAPPVGGAGGPQQPPAALLEPVVRASGPALARAPLPCAGLRSGARGVRADGGWHAYALHSAGGELRLELDGQTVARARWAPGEEARVVGLWVGTAEPRIAGRARPEHEPGGGEGGAGLADDEPGGAMQLAALEIFAPSLLRAERGAAPEGAPANGAPPPLVELPHAGWRAAAGDLPCDAAARARAAPLPAALGALGALCACALLARALLGRRCGARARYRRVGQGAAGPPAWGKAS